MNIAAGGQRLAENLLESFYSKFHHKVSPKLSWFGLRQGDVNSEVESIGVHVQSVANEKILMTSPVLGNVWSFGCTIV